MNKTIKPIEVAFNIIYLVSVFVIGLYLTIFAQGYKQFWGVMSLVLAVGDSFHLIPRIALAFAPNNTKLALLAGWGKMITSITMSIFYLILWHIGIYIYKLDATVYTIIIYVLVLARTVLCLLPRNNWTAVSPYKYTILRNIPFFLQGAMVMLLFLLNSNQRQEQSLVWLAILLSFLFYAPIIIFGHKNSKLAMLMLPKSLAYVWIVAIGLL